MHAGWLGRRILSALTAALVMAGIFTAVQGGTSASASVNWTSVPPVNPGDHDYLSAVTVLSPSNVWAVGTWAPDDIFYSLIEHWNGTEWTQVPSPNPGGWASEPYLTGVRGVSATDIWAVGAYDDSTTDSRRTLILHWNGTAWTQVPSPNPVNTHGFNVLDGVTAPSSGNAWAVGSYQPYTSGSADTSGSVGKSLVLHWNGTAWKQVASPNPGTRANELTAVGASSASAWAVGSYSSSTTQKTLVLRWNGTAWKRVASPNPGSKNSLNAVRSSSASNAWAVGSYFNGTANQTLILHWNGTAWRRVASPNPGGSARRNWLDGVAVISRSNAWAVGAYFDGTWDHTLVLHWNGTAWKRVASPNPGGSSVLSSVGASASANIWAVGTRDRKTLAIHCC